MDSWRPPAKGPWSPQNGLSSSAILRGVRRARVSGPVGEELGAQEVVHFHARLSEDCPKRSLRKIPGVIRNSRVSVRGCVEPDLVASPAQGQAPTTRVRSTGPAMG